MWRGQDARLLLHFESGFELVLAGADHDAGAGHDDGAVLWRFPFGRLRHSADDGVRLLWLDFGSDDGEMELNLRTCPKPLVFTLHSFLSAKINRMGVVT